MVEEVDRLGVAAVFATDSGLEVGTRIASFPGGDVDEPADAVEVEALERRGGEDPQLDISRRPFLTFDTFDLVSKNKLCPRDVDNQN